MVNGFKYKAAWLILVLAGSGLFSNLYSQDLLSKPSRETAYNAFSKGNYEQAYNEFSLLLQNYAKDPLYKYYSGVCLVNLTREPERAAVLLREALESPQEIKAIPDDAWFYLGRSQQLSGNFTEAVRSFGQFSSKAGKKRARSFKVEKYIQECKEGKGQIKTSDILKAEVADIQPSATGKEAEKTSVQKAEKSNPVKPQPKRENLSEEFDRMLTEGMDYQLKADSLTALSAEYKKVYQQLPASQRAPYRVKISKADSLAAYYQKMANLKLDTTGLKTGDQKAGMPERVSGQAKPVTDAGNLINVNKQEKTPASVTVRTDTVKRAVAVYSLFELIKNPARIQLQKIEIDPKMPEGLVYRIQIGVFSKPVTASFFKGISPVSGFKVQSSGMIRYFAGMFRKLTDANKALLTVKQLGFKDSFIVAVSDGMPVSLERASTLEKEWGGKTLISNTAVETGPSTLTFRVEISRSQKPLKDEITESYRKLAGNRGFEILAADDGTIVYLIGKFITFESAFEYADLLNRNGYREAKVAAYLGDKEIPVETAKQLFEKLE